MIRSHLSRLMGEKRVRIIDVARATGISRNLLAKLYNDRARRLEIKDLGKLCQFFGCAVGDLLEWTPDHAVRRTGAGRSSRVPKG
jgi:putative transcriptional regulator